MKKSFKLTPTLVSKSSECLHIYYLECFGDPSLKIEPDPGTQLIFQKGNDFEKACADSIDHLARVDWTRPHWQDGFKKTVELLKKGENWVYQGVLLKDGFFGNPDLLRRIPQKSLLGKYSYIPVDMKNHKAVKATDRLQLFAYAFMLEPVLGERPKSGAIWLNTGTVEEVNLNGPTEKKFFEVLAEMRAIQEGRLVTKAVQCTACTSCAWNSVCSDWWEKNNHLSLLSDMTVKVVGKLASEGIDRCDQLDGMSAGELSGKAGVDSEKAERMLASALSRKKNLPVILKKPKFPTGKTIYFYDIETFGDYVFLHGLIRLHKGKREEKFFFAGSKDEEKTAWFALLDYLAQDEDAVVYCWTMYEENFIHACWQRYGGNKKGYELLETRLTDQKEFAKDHFVFPCRGYSIKKVAPVFGFEWSDKDAGGMNCGAWYAEWQKTKDAVLYDRIIAYNRDDVLAMEVIDRELRSLAGGNK